jgi:hypothetical protein
MPNPNLDPRLLASREFSKGEDLEMRLVQHIAWHPPTPPSLVYGQTPGSFVQTANGTYTWTCPAGVTSARVQCWGAGASGGGGGTSWGGPGGGGGEYAEEPNYPLVPGQVYNMIVGNGGTGPTTGNYGVSGTDTIFDTDGFGMRTGVFANGGLNGSSGNAGGGAGGTGNTRSPNSISHAGGAGGATGAGAGSGGGGAGGTNTGGTGGSTGGASTGAAGGAGGSGGGSGGAGGNNAANGVNGNGPGGGGGGAGAATSATSGQSLYRLNSSATYYGSDASGGNANGQRMTGTMYQGGETASGGSYNGTMKSLGIIGGNPSSDLSGKTIDSVYIRLEWTHCWYNSGSYVVLGYAGYTSLPGSWSGSGITALKTWAGGPATDQGGGPFTTDMTNTGLGSGLASGAARAITLGPGPAFNLSYYGSMYGAGGDNNQNPLITVNWHTGSKPVTAGSGADGKIAISYQVSGVLQAALQSAAGVDDPSTNNAFAQGYTGNVSQFVPGSSPAVVEGWHTLGPNPSGMAGAIRYKLLAETNCMLLDVTINWTSTAGGTYTWPNFPAGYGFSNPAAEPRVYTMMGNATPSSTTSAMARLYLGGGNGCQIIVPATTGGGTASWTGIIPQD